MKRSNAQRRLLNARCIALVIALSLVTGASAQENPNVGRWYQVELILFEQRSNNDVNEVWETEPILTHLPQAHRLRQVARDDQIQTPLPAQDLQPRDELPLRWPLVNRANGTEEPFVVLPRPLLQLSEDAERIHQSRGRRVILHTGWNMPVSAEENTDYIRLHAGERYDDHYEVDGTLSIYVGRFLHVQTELNITRYELSDAPLPLFFGEDTLPQSLDPNGTRQLPMQSLESRSPTFRMGPRYVPVESAPFQETRRMRSNELHYIDHPRLGLIIQFTPYEPVQISPEGDFQQGGLNLEGDGMDALDPEEDMEGLDPDGNSIIEEEF